MNRGPEVQKLIDGMGPPPRVPESWQRVVLFSFKYYSRPQDDPGAEARELSNEEASIVWGGVSTTVSCHAGGPLEIDLILGARVEILGSRRCVKVDFGGGDYGRPYAAGCEVL